jgi:hypothetical protein
VLILVPASSTRANRDPAASPSASSRFFFDRQHRGKIRVGKIKFTIDSVD